MFVGLLLLWLLAGCSLFCLSICVYLFLPVCLSVSFSFTFFPFLSISLFIYCSLFVPIQYLTPILLLSALHPPPLLSHDKLKIKIWTQRLPSLPSSLLVTLCFDRFLNQAKLPRWRTGLLATPAFFNHCPQLAQFRNGRSRFKRSCWRGDLRCRECRRNVSSDFQETRLLLSVSENDNR